MGSNLLARTGFIPANTTIRVRSVALPAEHGAWGFLLEPVLLGLIAAPSLAGFGLCLAATGGVLFRQPVKIAYSDRHRGKRYERTRIAERFALLYSAVSLFGILIALAAGGPSVLFPLIAALPVAAIQLLGTLWNRGRDVLPELAGAAALGITAPAVALAGNVDTTIAFGFWIVMLGRDIPSILYVRARLRLEKKQPTSIAPSVGLSVAAVVIAGMFTLAGWVQLLAVVALTILAVRAAVGLSTYRNSRPAKVIGFQEIAYGLLVAILTATGYHLGL